MVKFKFIGATKFVVAGTYCEWPIDIIWRLKLDISTLLDLVILDEINMKIAEFEEEF